jgi:CBS domain containing-hemolysin-like protein
MKELSIRDIGDQDHMIQRKKDFTICLHDSALEVFIDYSREPPLVINGNAKAIEAQHLLRLSPQPIVVVDEHADFVGIVTANELNDIEIVKRISEGFLREELKVLDFALTKSVLKRFYYDDLARASVGDAITVLRENGQQKCLVVDDKTHEILGIICRSKIEARLQQVIFLDGKTTSEKLTQAIYKQVHPRRKLHTVL